MDGEYLLGFFMMEIVMMKSRPSTPMGEYRIRIANYESGIAYGTMMLVSDKKINAAVRTTGISIQFYPLGIQ